MKKIIYILIPGLAILFFLTIKFSNIEGGDKKFVNVKIRNIIVKSEVSDTPDKRYRGLSGRESLKEGMGMLFIFNEYIKSSFVMRDMKFSIDMIWIRDNNVVDISENLPLPKNNAPLIEYSPKSEVNRVIEVEAGFVNKNQIHIGDKVDP